ncbi:MAG: hypothetical protein ACLFVO_08790 [Chloroflexaceae bacterium]
MDKPNQKADLITLFSKGALGALPIVGPLAAEIIGTLIPDQRIDRIARFLHALEQRLTEVEQRILNQRVREGHTEFIDLFEDGMYHAARALNQERIEYIASLIKNSLSDEDVEYVYYKQLLMLLSEINEIEVLILKYHSLTPEQTDKFRKSHEDVLKHPVVVFGTPQENIDKNTVHSSFEHHLVRLGLLQVKFKKPKKGELPTFDEKTGMIAAKGFQITPLGRLLLRHIDQEPDSRD